VWDLNAGAGVPNVLIVCQYLVGVQWQTHNVTVTGPNGGWIYPYKPELSSLWRTVKVNPI